MQAKVARSLMMAMMFCGAGFAQDAPQPPSQPPPQPATLASTQSQVAADDGFIEFLGADDVDDTAWWEFLQRAPPPLSKSGEATQQDAKK